mgnify:CR=1 FL=1
MKYKQTLILKNGKTCIFRHAETADAAEVLRSFLQTHGETDNLLTYPEESKMTVDGEADFLQKTTDSENAIELCAVVDGKLVGTAGIEPIGAREKLRHRAEFGISIEKAYWGQGIGRALTAACIEIAKAAGYAQLELQVVADNAAAVALYKSLGFTEYGRNPLGFRSRTTGWQPLILMRLEL